MQSILELQPVQLLITLCASSLHARKVMHAHRVLSAGPGLVVARRVLALSKRRPGPGVCLQKPRSRSACSQERSCHSQSESYV